MLINDLLACGEVADLFPDDEMDNILASLRSEVKGSGLIDSRENCSKFFVERVRKQMKVCIVTYSGQRRVRRFLLCSLCVPIISCELDMSVGMEFHMGMEMPWNRGDETEQSQSWELDGK